MRGAITPENLEWFEPLMTQAAAELIKEGGCPFFYRDCAGWVKSGGFGLNYSGKTRKAGCHSP